VSSENSARYTLLGFALVFSVSSENSARYTLLGFCPGFLRVLCELCEIYGFSF
jgi:hypothetical protein